MGDLRDGGSAHVHKNVCICESHCARDACFSCVVVPRGRWGPARWALCSRLLP